MCFLFGTALFWSSWINTLKMTKGSRFEIYYLNFVFGVMLALLLHLFFLYAKGYDVIYEIKNLWHKEFILFSRAFFAGILFNIANTLLVASSVFAGIVPTFMTVFGAGLIADQGIYSYDVTDDNTLLFFLSSLLLSSAIFWMFSLQKILRFSVAKRTLTLSCIAGVFVGLFYPLFDRALDPKDIQKLNPTLASTFLGLGIAFCQGFLGPVLFKKPIFGHPLDFRSYFQAPYRHHVLGVLGGVFWFAGLVLKLHAENTPHELAIFFIVQTVPLVVFLYGIFLWKEIPKELHYNKSLVSIFCLYSLGVLCMAYYRYGF